MKLGKAFTRSCIALALVAGVAQAAMADQLDDIKKAGKIRVAIAMGTPLFSFADANLQPTGSDVDTVQTAQAWRLYRSTESGNYSAAALIHEVIERTSELDPDAPGIHIADRSGDTARVGCTGFSHG